VIEYPGRIKIFRGRQILIEYLLKPEDVKYQQVWPENLTKAPNKPRKIRLTSEEDELKLRAYGDFIGNFLDFIQSKEGAIRYRNQFVKNLYSLSLRIAPGVFQKTIERAHAFKINSIEAIERIAIQLMRVDVQDWPEISSTKDFENRLAYQDGRLTAEPDLFSWAKFASKNEGSDDGSGSENR